MGLLLSHWSHNSHEIWSVSLSHGVYLKVYSMRQVHETAFDRGNYETKLI